MLPPNPLLQLVPSRVLAAVERIEKQIWRFVMELPAEATRARLEPRSLVDAQRERRQRLARPHHWGRLYDQRWVRVVLPAQPARGARYLHWRDQGEATLFVDGAPYYGFDVAHRYCALPAGVREAWLECWCVRSAIWHPDAAGGLDPAGSRCDGAWLVERDERAWKAYHDLKVLAELMIEERANHPALPAFERFRHQMPVEQATVLYRRLLRRLDQAIDALDTGGLVALERALAGVYREFRAEPLALAAILTGHAHIDLVWLWPERIGEAKAVHSFATADRLMALYPEFRFAFSQPASYAAVARRSPQLHQRVRRRIREGRWEATGALEVESDTLLPGGEGLVRSFLLGQEGFAALRAGEPSRVLWLPDVFGYAACVPQLMRQCGVEYFFTTKLTWGAVTRFPYSSFVWRGDDGSEVVAHVVSQAAGYNGKATVGELRGHALAHRQSDVHNEMLVPTGWGDGGGGPTEEMCERARRMADLASVPRVQWGGIEAFFERLGRLRDQLPTYQGECYLEYHRGTFTTHGAVKAAFRALERALQTQEAVACATGGGPIDAHPWRRLVFAQFHDYLPGSSVPEVYREGIAEQQRLTATATAAARSALERATGEACVFNPTPLCRTERVRVGRTVRLISVPPLSGVTLRSAARPAPTDVRIAERELANEWVTARFERDGSIVSLVVEGQPVALRPGAAGLWVYPDRPAMFDAWDIDRQALALGRRWRRPVAVRSGIATGDAFIEFEHRLGAKTRATIRFALRPAESVLRVTVTADWHEPHTLVKLLFPTRYAARGARFGAPFGSAVRSQQPGRPADEAMWEVPGSRWAAVFDEGERDGLFVVSESKYGFSARDGVLGVSLLRSVASTGFDAKHAPAYPPTLLRGGSDSQFSDLGRHEIALAVGRYDTALPRERHPAALAETLFTPLIAYRGRPLHSGLVGLAGAPSLQPCWAKPLGRDRWLLRLHETLGRHGEARLDLAPEWTARKTTIAEMPGLELRDGRLAFGPYEIVSVVIERARTAAKHA